MPTFAIPIDREGVTKKSGAIAQLVEQRTENPCVPGSIPGGTTQKTAIEAILLRFLFYSGSSLNSYLRLLGPVVSSAQIRPFSF